MEQHRGLDEERKAKTRGQQKRDADSTGADHLTDLFLFPGWSAREGSLKIRLPKRKIIKKESETLASRSDKKLAKERLEAATYSVETRLKEVRLWINAR